MTDEKKTPKKPTEEPKTVLKVGKNDLSIGGAFRLRVAGHQLTAAEISKIKGKMVFSGEKDKDGKKKKVSLLSLLIKSGQIIEEPVKTK